MTNDVDVYDDDYCDSYDYGDDFNYHPNSEFLGSNIETYLQCLNKKLLEEYCTLGNSLGNFRRA